ncbi:hypothetical protein PHLGIDRAFT_422087 [Phlebiopsis gigantea 11061_1 CR5-6]|uniref:DUF6534 domain-containing protein n=1 Tax=Phlebiopsis gigantea (strain 11061_1 CR5-6) TaxID=745531 RepID=A0A0C3SAV9_PHLG1|nr:hypothetical protein PHLGIDRAFT_422087 [Phlebiopsis gigantea 11061_1 CR5-6]
MSQPPPAIPPRTLALTLGAFEVSFMVTCVFLGILIVQCKHFLKNFSSKSKAITYIICIILICNVFHILCAMYSVYRRIVYQWGSPKALLDTMWSDYAIITSTAITRFLIQAVYTHRIRILSKRKGWAIFLGIWASLTSVASLALSGYYYTLHQFSQMASVNWLLFIAHSGDAFMNFVIAIVYCSYLRENRKAALPRTRSFIDMLVVYGINSGLYGTLIPIFVVVLRVVQPDNWVFFAAYMPYSTVYSMSLLASVNARDWLQNRGDIITIPLSHLREVYGSDPAGIPSSNAPSCVTSEGEDASAKKANM